MNVAQVGVLAFELVVLGGCVAANVRIHRRRSHLERHAGASLGGLLDELAFGWVLKGERELAADIEQRLTMLLVVPADKAWDRRAMVRIVRRNEVAIAIGSAEAAVLLWHADDRGLYAAIARVATAIDELHPGSEVGWASADADDAGADELIARARQSTCAARSVRHLAVEDA